MFPGPATLSWHRPKRGLRWPQRLSGCFEDERKLFPSHYRTLVVNNVIQLCCKSAFPCHLCNSNDSQWAPVTITHVCGACGAVSSCIRWPLYVHGRVMTTHTWSVGVDPAKCICYYYRLNYRAEVVFVLNSPIDGASMHMLREWCKWFTLDCPIESTTMHFATDYAQ
jgi:hypothetical protein